VNKKIKVVCPFLLSMLLVMPFSVSEAQNKAEKNKKADVKTASLAAPFKGTLGRVVTEIEGKAVSLPAPLTLESRRERNMAGKVISDPNLKLISDRLMTQASIWHIPEDYKSTTIMGDADVTRQQAIALLELYNPKLPIAATPEEIVDLYYKEARREGIRWDIAFCQALVETGFFTFGGTVVPAQNNFCGLGTTGGGVRGAYFSTPELGVRAHIQHLMAYTTDRAPQTPIVDPRYDMVVRLKKNTGFATTWSQLNGTWAMGSYYSEKIMNIHEQMKTMISVSGGQNLF
jgi:hypothetical protein